MSGPVTLPLSPEDKFLEIVKRTLRNEPDDHIVSNKISEEFGENAAAAVAPTPSSRYKVAPRFITTGPGGLEMEGQGDLSGLKEGSLDGINTTIIPPDPNARRARTPERTLGIRRKPRLRTKT